MIAALKDEEQSQLQPVERKDIDDEDDLFKAVDKLIAQGITAEDVRKLEDARMYTYNGLIMKKSLTAEISGLSEAKVEKIREAAEKIVRKSVVKITTGSQAPDELSGGGIETHSITETFGEFRSGETQLADTSCVSTQLPTSMNGGNGKVAYIDTEGTFRLDQTVPIAEGFAMEPQNQIEKDDNTNCSVQGVKFNLELGLVSMCDSWEPCFRTPATFQVFSFEAEVKYCHQLMRKFLGKEWMIREYQGDHGKSTLAVEPVRDLNCWVEQILKKDIFCFREKFRMVIKDVLFGLFSMHQMKVTHGNLIHGIGVTDDNRAKLMNMKLFSAETPYQNIEHDFKELVAVLNNAKWMFREKKEELLTRCTDALKKKLRHCHMDPCHRQLVQFLDGDNFWKFRWGIYFHPLGQDNVWRVSYMRKIAKYLQQQNSLKKALNSKLSSTLLVDWREQIRKYSELDDVYRESRTRRTKLCRGLNMRCEAVYTAAGRLPNFLRNCLEHPAPNRDEYYMESLYTKVFPSLYSDLHLAFLEILWKEDLSGTQLTRLYFSTIFPDVEEFKI